MLGLAALMVVAAPFATAEAKKKKKKKAAVVTKSTQVPFGSGTSVIGAATCSGKTHVTGGGYAVSPNFAPPATGLRSVHVSSNPAGTNGWTAGAGAFGTPISAGTFTTFAQCEGNNLGKIAGVGSSSVVLAPGIGQNLVFNCAPGSHVLSGGFAGTAPGNFTNIQTWYRTIVLQNRRTGPGQWTITGYNHTQSGVTATLTGFAICERNAKGLSVSEASAFTPLTENARAAVDPSCGGKTHVISGGFLVSPPGPGVVPGVGVDEMQPVGRKGWHVGLHDFVNVTLPAGSSLQGFAYCKKG